jgi:hypothetical protein
MLEGETEFARTCTTMWAVLASLMHAETRYVIGMSTLPVVLPLCVTGHATCVSKELQRARRRSFELCVMVAKKRKRRRILDHDLLFRYEYLNSEAVGNQLRASHFLISNA